MTRYCSFRRRLNPKASSANPIPSDEMTGIAGPILRRGHDLVPVATLSSSLAFTNLTLGH